MTNRWFDEVFLPSFEESDGRRFISEKQLEIFRRNLKFKEKKGIYGDDSYLEAEKNGKRIQIRWNYQRCGRSKSKKFVYTVTVTH